MADLVITNTLANGTTADASEVQTNFNDIKNYINARNDGTTAWDNVKGASGTFSGDVAMGSNSITALAAAVADGEATRFEQVYGPYVPVLGGTLSASVAASALTISLKTKGAGDPSSTETVPITFRNVTAATGTYSMVAASAATSLTISSGSTLGTTNSTAFRIWVVMFNDGGTLRLGAINCLSTLNIYGLSQFGIASSTTEGGAGGADAAATFYSGTGVTSKAYTVLGYMTWESGLATAGTWSSGPTRIDLFRPGVPLPGTIVQAQRSSTKSATTGTTAIPEDNTIPQNTEGDQYLTVSITPSSAANILRYRCVGNGSHSSNTTWCMAIFRDATANAINAVKINHGTAARCVPAFIEDAVIAGQTTSTTFNVRAGAAAGATFTFNGDGGATVYGGTVNSFLEIEEVMV